jgi:hypothetical protein
LISLKLNFSEFVASVINKDKHIILSLAESEAKEAEKLSEMMGHGHDYVDALAGLIYFLRNSQKPLEIKEKHLKIYRVICEKLIVKNQLSSDILKIFDY